MFSEKIIHNAIQLSCRQDYLRFKYSLDHCETIQREVLVRILDQLKGLPSLNGLSKSDDYDRFKRSIRVSEYKDWQTAIEKQRITGEELVARNIIRFEPTSGSTDYLKWIPYTDALKLEFDRASAPWIYDLYRQYPGIKKGKHFWSLSWMPDDLREQQNNDDLEVFPWYKKLLLSRVMLLDESISKMPTSRMAQVESLIRLCQQNVSLISVWSPTHLLSLMNILFEEKTFISKALRERGAWRKQEILSWHDEPTAEFTREMWPELALISAWDTSTSYRWASKVQEMFQHCQFQGKGLWATEGVVTIPFENQFPLAVRSHFFEFECLETKRVLPAWNLEEGQQVRPLLTTGSGLLRYGLNDRLLVTGFYGRTPCFTFLNRLKDVDMAGEKISYDQAIHILNEIEEKTGHSAVTLFAHSEKEDRHYELLMQGRADESFQAEVEHLLAKSFHYRLARDLGQLRPARVTVRPDAMEYYYEKCCQRIPVSGNIKPEPLVLLEGGTL